MVIRPIYAALPFEQQAFQSVLHVAIGAKSADLRKALVFEATPPGYRPGVV